MANQREADEGAAVEEEAVVASTEGRIGAKEGGEGEEASAAQIGRVQKWRK